MPFFVSCPSVMSCSQHVFRNSLKLSYWCIELGNTCQYCPSWHLLDTRTILRYVEQEWRPGLLHILEIDRIQPNFAEIRGRFPDSRVPTRVVWAHTQRFPGAYLRGLIV
jgi:hypothetical protein